MCKSAVEFWYRQSPETLMPLQLLGDNTSIGRITGTDPPVDGVGEIVMVLDPLGHLTNPASESFANKYFHRSHRQIGGLESRAD